MLILNRDSDGEGPECPFCKTIVTADAPIFYEENGFQIDCDECGKKYQVWPNISVSWRTEAVKEDI